MLTGPASASSVSRGGHIMDFVEHQLVRDGRAGRRTSASAHEPDAAARRGAGGASGALASSQAAFRDSAGACAKRLGAPKPKPLHRSRRARQSASHETPHRTGPLDHPQLAPRDPGRARRHRALRMGRDVARRSSSPRAMPMIARATPPRASPASRTGMTYSRLQNPTVRCSKSASRCWKAPRRAATMATGMAAMTAVLLCQLAAGRSCRRRPRRVRLVPLADRYAAAAASASRRRSSMRATRSNSPTRSQPNTKVFFFETPANPTMDIVDLQAVCDIARERGITSVVDNAFATPALQRPMEFGADVVAYSATKMMDGQGRVLAGAVCGTRGFHQRHAAALHAQHRADAQRVQRLGGAQGAGDARPAHPPPERECAQGRRASSKARVPRMLHPGLASHPQHNLAMTPDGRVRPDLRVRSSMAGASRRMACSTRSSWSISRTISAIRAR